MTVLGLIEALKNYAGSAPGNGSAQIVLRSPDGEVCFPHFAGCAGQGLPGENYFVLSPLQLGKFRMLEAMKVN